MTEVHEKSPNPYKWLFFGLLILVVLGIIAAVAFYYGVMKGSEMQVRVKKQTSDVKELEKELKDTSITKGPMQKLKNYPPKMQMW